MTNHNRDMDLDAFDKSIQIWNHLRSASDHEIVVIGGARLDAALYHLLSMRLAKYDRAIDDTLSPSGPTGTFSAKINLALLTGSINEGTCRELHRIRKIRNTVAHNVELADLSDGTLKDQCNSLCTPNTMTSDASAQLLTTPRRHFEITVSLLELDLMRNSQRIKRILTPMPSIALMEKHEQESFYSNVENGKLILDGKIYDINDKNNFY